MTPNFQYLMEAIQIVLVVVVGLVVFMLVRPTRFGRLKKRVGNPNLEVVQATSIFYHQDDYRQVELVPQENLPFFKQEMAAFAYKSSQGDVDIHQQVDDGIPLHDRGIDPDDLNKQLLRLGLPRFNRVSTGVRPGEMKSERTFGYGDDNNAIFFDEEISRVKNIWFVGQPKVELKLLSNILYELGQDHQLVLMDWNRLKAIELNDREQIDNYLSRRLR
ncbi:MAG: hypothetical protein ACFB10_18520 [Salibacteraceae bacterium]